MVRSFFFLGLEPFGYHHACHARLQGPSKAAHVVKAMRQEDAERGADEDDDDDAVLLPPPPRRAPAVPAAPKPQPLPGKAASVQPLGDSDNDDGGIPNAETIR